MKGIKNLKIKINENEKKVDGNVKFERKNEMKKLAQKAKTHLVDELGQKFARSNHTTCVHLGINEDSDKWRFDSFYSDIWNYITGYGKFFSDEWYSSNYKGDNYYNIKNHKISIGDALKEYLKELCDDVNGVLKKFTQKHSWNSYNEIDYFNLMWAYYHLDMLGIIAITESQRRKLAKFIKEQNFGLTFMKLDDFCRELIAR